MRLDKNIRCLLSRHCVLTLISIVLLSACGSSPSTPPRKERAAAEAEATEQQHGGQMQLLHRNDMSSNFRLKGMTYILDGSIIHKQFDRNGSLNQRVHIDILSGSLVAGNHTVQVKMIYQSTDLEFQSRIFKLDEVHKFRVEEDKRVVVRAIVYERGDAGLDPQDRPAIRFEHARAHAAGTTRHPTPTA